MYLVLEKQFLQRLKIILQSNIFYLILITFSIIYVFYFTKIKKYNSIYDNNQKEVVGIISKIIINDDNIKLTLKSNEDIIVTYYRGVSLIYVDYEMITYKIFVKGESNHE